MHQGSLSPRFLGRVGRTPLSPTLTWRQFQMPSRKGIKNRLFRTDAHQCLFSVWEPPMIYLAWKVLGALSRFRWWEKHTSQNVFISKFFVLSSGTSTNPYFPLRRAFLLLYAIFIFNLSLHLLLYSTN